MTPDHGGSLFLLLVLFGTVFCLFDWGFIFCGSGGLLLPGGGALVLGHGKISHLETGDQRRIIGFGSGQNATTWGESYFFSSRIRNNFQW
ncbi:hypothetical protein [Rhizobium mesosinicum]|uniref:hypothetical protein n=1 Tax=Rhizobium mesosinicum TaxID=335017 RepID=UPI001CB7788F|nr:hypothetical protein [Rhizobium mesosinicum]